MSARATFARGWSSFRRSPPTMWEFAIAPLVGALAVTVVNVAAVWVVLGAPTALGLRLQHHAFDALANAAAAGWLALVAAALGLAERACLSRARRAVDPRHLRLAAYGAYAALACLGMQSILGEHFRRQADAALDGRFARPLEALMLVGAGVGLLAAQLLGGLARRCSRDWSKLVATGALAALIAHHTQLRDDYAHVHAGITWAAATLLGSATAYDARRLFAARPKWLVALLALGGLGTLVEPSNAVRLELFRECGSVAPWLFARTVWRLPTAGSRAPAPPPRPQLVAPRSAARSSSRALVQAPVVVIITVDALRADVLSTPKYARRFPHLSRLTNEGLYVPRAVSPGSQTSVSLSAMFSGRPYSGQRWALHGEGSARFLYAADDPTVRFPSRLERAGIRTEGFFALQFFAGDFGVTRGFRREHMLTLGRKHASADAIMKPLLATLDKLKPGEPAMLFAHLTEPHEPYDRGRLREGSDFDRYLSEVEVVDAWLGKLLAKLRARAPGRGYVVLSADHGEAFGEHGTKFHTKTLYDELLRVPLVLWGPKILARRCDVVASLLDVGPTVLELFGVPNDPESMGESLVPIARGQLPCEAPRLPVVAEGRLRRALYTQDGLKVIEDRVHKTVEVFDLVRDPGELANLYPDDPRSGPPLAALRATFEARALPGYEPPYKP